MNLLKIVSTAFLVVTLSVVSLSAGKKTPPAPHFLVYDLKTEQFVVLDAPDGATIYVASPDGIQPGVFAGKSSDGKKILILPPSLIGQDDSQPTPPAVQPQSERLDRARKLITISN